MPSKERAAKLAEAMQKEPVPVPPTQFSADYHTAQIYSTGFEFAFMSFLEGAYKQICTFVYCKDFLHDLVWSFVNKKKWSIYSFKYDPAKDLPLDTAHTVFAFRNTQYKGKEAEFHTYKAACIDFLHQIEAKLGFSPSQVFEVPHPEAPTWLIIGDKSWQHAPVMVGLYTLFIRIGCLHTPGVDFTETIKKAQAGKLTFAKGQGSYAGNKDGSYLSEAKKGVEVILKHGLKIFHPKMEDNYPSILSGLDLHNNFGPVNFTEAYVNQNNIAKKMPFWYRDEIWK